MEFLNRVRLRRAAPDDEKEEIALDPRRLARIRRNADLVRHDDPQQDFQSQDDLFPRPVVMVRRRLAETPPFAEWRSWMGGLPRLGDAPWPRGADGRPLRFAAQLDLAELTAQCPETPLPRMGSLAFFLGSGAVVETPVGTPCADAPPADLPPAYEEGGLPEPEQASLLQQPLFPCWPMQLIGLAMPEDMRALSGAGRFDEIRRHQDECLAATGIARSGPFSVAAARAQAVASADMLWWHAAIFVRDRLLQSIADAGDDDRHQSGPLADFAGRMDAFIGEHGAWDIMDDDAKADLFDALQIIRRDFGASARDAIPADLDPLRELCIRRMLAGDDSTLAALPADMLSFIEDNHRLAPGCQHQIFGLGAGSQPSRHDKRGMLLLLQIGRDDLAEMRYGQNGVWQYWISPADAAAGRWDQVTLTFEEESAPAALPVKAELSGEVAPA